MTVRHAVFDHLTVGASSLEVGVAHVQRCLGVVVPPGGAHPLMATHNHLMRLVEGAFLEIIAPDPYARPQRKRWFDLDNPTMRSRLEESPRLINWVVRVNDLTQTLGEIDEEVGEPVAVTRGALSWLISVRPDGAMPFDGAFPTLIEWPAGPHPSARMADLGCCLERLSMSIPRQNACPACSRSSSPMIAS
nr:VOC family protein [Bradyrhizobium sp. 138]